MAGVFGGYAGGGIRAGFECDLLKTDEATGGSEKIIAGCANYELRDNFDFYGRVDIRDPDTGTEKDLEYYMIGGFAYSPGKGLVIAPNIRYSASQKSSADPEIEYKINFEFKF